jgi:hypothetical protein
MTKTELQVALAAATETNKRTAGVFLETLSALAYKEIKKQAYRGLGLRPRAKQAQTDSATREETCEKAG